MTRLAGKATLSALALGLAIFGLTSVPGHVYAQGNDDGGSITDPANKKINLDLESTNLYYGLKLLFSQVKANFTIDESLKSLTVTAHLTDVPFRVALETLLKSTGTPLTYKVENGIYSVVPKVEEAQPQEEPTIPEPEVKSGGYKYGIIHPSNLSAIDIVQAFGGNIVSVGYDSKAYGTGGMGGMGMGGMGMGGMGMGGMGMGGMGMGGMGMGGLGGGLGGFGGGGYGGYGGGGYGGYGGSNNFGRGGGIGGGYGGGGIGRGF